MFAREAGGSGKQNMLWGEVHDASPCNAANRVMAV
jgi:hypothetical protein